tara:strand:+ start:330 stop:434 length:105 start_codon:yes stop_codon:yes gene_type:complete
MVQQLFEEAVAVLVTTHLGNPLALVVQVVEVLEV